VSFSCKIADFAAIDTISQQSFTATLRELIIAGLIFADEESIKACFVELIFADWMS